jgi:hypothetical protein
MFFSYFIVNIIVFKGGNHGFYRFWSSRQAYVLSGHFKPRGVSFGVSFLSMYDEVQLDKKAPAVQLV